jgi:hypothetical protein
MSKTLPRATLLFSRVPVWTEATAVHAVVIPSGEKANPNPKPLRSW